MKTLFIAIFFIQIGWGQTSMNECISITHDVIQDIEANNLESALEFFDNQSVYSKTALKKATLVFQSYQSQLYLKEISMTTKEHFINRCIYKSNEGEIFLLISFYYKKSNESSLINKIEVKDKDYFVSRRKSSPRIQNSLKRTPPPEIINN